MADKYILATLHNISPIPDGSIYRGNGIFDFVVSNDPPNIKEKLSEHDDKLNLVFKKPGFAVEGRAEKVKKSK